MSFYLPVTRIAHQIVGDVVASGDIGIDATAGNGHDTCFLARTVGAEGCVYAFDIQDEAIERTRERLRGEELRGHVHLHRECHARLADVLPQDIHGDVAAVMFNLGYLPRGDYAIKTEPSSTIPALGQALDVLRSGGVLTIVLYTGHEGGAEEASAVEIFASALDRDRFSVVRWSMLNEGSAPPYVIAIRRR